METKTLSYKDSPRSSTLLQHPRFVSRVNSDKSSSKPLSLHSRHLPTSIHSKHLPIPIHSRLLPTSIHSRHLPTTIHSRHRPTSIHSRHLPTPSVLSKHALNLALNSQVSAISWLSPAPRHLRPRTPCASSSTASFARFHNTTTATTGRPRTRSTAMSRWEAPGAVSGNTVRPA